MSNPSTAPKPTAFQRQATIYKLSDQVPPLIQTLDELLSQPIEADRQRGVRNVFLVLKNKVEAGLGHPDLLMIAPPSVSQDTAAGSDPGTELRSLHAPVVAAINATMPDTIRDPRALATTKAQLREMWTHIGMWLIAADNAETATDPVTACQQAEPFLQTR